MLIPQYINNIHKVFQKYNYQLYLVGGCVRDYVMNIEPKDYDLTTNSLPDDMITFLSKEGYKLNLVGKKFGVIKVYGKDLKEELEIATFRTDIGTGRHPEIKVGATIEEDIKRRDLTINALYYDLDKKEVIDLVGGLDDIKNKIIRMVGDPIERIKDDNLRSIRFFRFAKKYDFSYNEESLNAVINNTDLSIISKERIWDEVKKAFHNKNFKDFLNELIKYKLFTKELFNLNIDYIEYDSKYLFMYITQLFKNNSYKTIERDLTVNNRLEYYLAGRVYFALSLQNFNPEIVKMFYNSRNRFDITDNKLVEIISILYKDNESLVKFSKYKPTIKPDDLVKLGFKGKELGNKIKELEYNLFKNL